jgi:HSP20 family protein
MEDRTMVRRIEGWPFEGLTSNFSELDRFRRELDRLLNGRVLEEGVDRSAGVFPLLNVSHDQENYYVRSEVPGMSLKELDVSVTGRSLTVSGERKIPNEDQRVRYHRREREAGRFRRQLNLPTDVDGEKVQAKYRHGVLTVVLPKAESAKPKKIEISA